MSPLQSNLLSRHIVLLLYLSLVVCGAIVTYDFNITWVITNPDGAFQRPTIGINGQWPIPQIRATVGDGVVVNVNNQLGNQSTSLHFHGLFMNGTTHMDGPVGTSQCSIPPGSSFTYKFQVDQPGTYWYHSHDSGQYPDGLRGTLIVEDPESPYKGLYDEEIVLTVSDWYHDQMRPLLQKFVSVVNPKGAEPVPNGALMNDTQNLTIAVEPGKTYMFRMINMGAFAGQYLWFEGHTMRIVEVDGIYTDPAEAEMIYITTAQRYSVLVTMRNDTDSNFAIVSSMDETLFDTIPPGLNPNVTGWLMYDKTKDLPKPALIDEFNAFDDFTLVPTDGMETYHSVDHSITLDVKMGNLGDGANYAFFNNITFVRPKVPTLYSVMSSGSLATNSEIYGTNTNPFILKKGEIVEIILNNDDAGRHPFHLHGHTFQTVARSEEAAGFYSGNATLPKVPMRRDTIMVNPNGNLVLRFKADNPDEFITGVPCFSLADGFFHVSATMIEAPEELQKSLVIPQDHFQVCHEQGLPTSGNAAGNTKDLLDLTGANLSPAPLPAGFTARGIVALVFSCLSAFLGIAVIAWYGVGEIGASELAAAKKRIAQAGIEL